MNDSLMDCLVNPIKGKLLLQIGMEGQMTAKQLSQVCPTVSQATLYRYLNKMTKDGILEVVQENKVRGVVEKVYALAVDFHADIQKIIEEKSGGLYLQLFARYLLSFFREFQEYTVRADLDLFKDQSGFSLAPIYATDEELHEAIGKIGDIINALYQNGPSPGRNLRTIGLIIAPPRTARNQASKSKSSSNSKPDT